MPTDESNLTLDDIARLADVSRSTVSRVINHHPNVSEQVRQRVWEVVDITGYSPNLAARSLALQRSSIIGLVIPRTVQALFSDPYFPRLAEGVAQACNEHNYILSLFLFSSEEDELRLIPGISRRSFMDGIIIQSTHADSELFVQLNRSKVPYVVAGRPMDACNCSYVDVDNVTGAYAATMHLIRLGRQRIGAIMGPLSTTAGLDRYQGYQKALRESALSFDEELCTEGVFTESSGYYCTQRLLPLRPDALFVVSDIMALGALRAIREAGLRVPQDVAIVAYDDLPIAAQASPPLTTVRQPIRRLGLKLVETLLDIIRSERHPFRHVVFDTELVVRESCGSNLKTSTRPL